MNRDLEAMSPGPGVRAAVAGSVTGILIGLLAWAPTMNTWVAILAGAVWSIGFGLHVRGELRLSERRAAAARTAQRGQSRFQPHIRDTEAIDVPSWMRDRR